MIPPYHGGRMINIPDIRDHDLDINNRIKIDISSYINLTLLKHGILSPVNSFHNLEETMEIANSGRLPNGLPWSIPVLLPENDEKSIRIKHGDEIILEFDGKDVALLKVDERFSLNMREYCFKIFGTTSNVHPGVMNTQLKGNRFISGKLLGISLNTNHFSTKQPVPETLRKLFKARRFKSVTAFQTRNPPHRGHEFLHKHALLSTDALLINPVLGPKKWGDFSDQEIFESYNIYLDKYLPKRRTILLPLIYEMQYAGPREALIHMIMRKNMGCTHFVIGRDHAGVGSFYHPYAAKEYVSQFRDIGIVPIFLKEAYYCKTCREISNDDICPHDEGEKIHFSGTKIRSLFLENKAPMSYEMRSEVYHRILEIRSNGQNSGRCVETSTNNGEVQADSTISC